MEKTQDKKFYWIKLKEAFMTGEQVDFLMGQQNGSDYVVLYLMLCLKTTNTDGRLESNIGGFVTPYDVAKITRDCKFFKYDTVVIALNLYRQLGLIYEEKDGVLQISNYQNMVGSETYWAERKRVARNKSDGLGLPAIGQSPGQCPGHCQDNVFAEKKALDKVLDNVQTMSSQNHTSYEDLDDRLDKVLDNVQQEIRDKNVVNIYTNNVRAREELKAELTKNLMVENISVICEASYGTDEVLHRVLDILLDFLLAKKPRVIKGVEYDFDFLSAQVMSLDTDGICKIIRQFYEENGSSWKRKHITDELNYILYLWIQIKKIRSMSNE